MDNGFKIKNQCPYENASILNKIFFIWIIKAFYKIAKNGLEINDLFKMDKQDSSEYLGDELEKNWNSEIARAKEKNVKPSLSRAIVKTFMWRYLFCVFLGVILHLFLRPAQPIFLAIFIKAFSDKDLSKRRRVIFNFGIGFVCTVIAVIYLVRNTSLQICLVGHRIKVALSSIIYRKMLRITKKSLSQATTGQLVNLLSNDLNKFDGGLLPLSFIFVIPIQMGLIIYLLWLDLGVSCLPGIFIVIFLTAPLQGPVSKMTINPRLKFSQFTDKRIKLINEIISGIQVIKMYCWEQAQQKIIRNIRNQELQQLKLLHYMKSVYWAMATYLDKFGIFGAILCYYLLGNHLTPEVIFPMVLQFHNIRFTLGFSFAYGLNHLSDMVVSIKRFQEFLLIEEHEEVAIEPNNNKEIIVTNVKASWCTTSLPALYNINLHIEPGSLCVIMGKVGSGKSSILHLFLSEIQKVAGSIKLGGTISYSSQEAWLFPSSLRKNILFGQPFIKSHYENVVEVCALEKDFENLPHGDSSIVGDRGICLSGGQKARVNLARAVYKDADIYLFDDPLSAVDPTVGRHIFEECFQNFLNGKTRILVTHQVQYVRDADRIFILKNGTLDAQGTFEELSKKYIDFSKLILEEEKESSPDLQTTNGRSELRSSICESTDSTVDDEQIAETANEYISPFQEYIKAAGSYVLVIVFIILVIAMQFLESLSEVLLVFWSNINTSYITDLNDIVLIFYNLNGLPANNSNDYVYNMEETNILGYYSNDIFLTPSLSFYIYLTLIVLMALFILLKSLLYVVLILRSSKSLHDRMLNTLLQVPMRFYDTNPSGRILNRFAKDMGSADEVLPASLTDGISMGIFECGLVITVVIFDIYSIFIIIPFALCFWSFLKYYRKSTKHLSHLEGITKSPIFSHINATANGISTVRSCKAQEILIKEFDQHQDVHSCTCILLLAISELFGLLIDVLTGIMIIYVLFSFIIMQYYQEVNKSVVGLCICNSLMLLGTLQYATRVLIDAINDLSSVHRLIEYTKLETEGPFEMPNGQFQKIEGPIKGGGHIEFRNVFLRYQPNGKFVLKNISFVIEEGSRIGIIGRTGAGKSSIVNALFRLTQIEGSILLDGVDTKDMGLHDLRRRISIIPQQPVLFPDTVRMNLDPYNQFEDSRIWAVLEEVKLKDIIPSLDLLVSTGGDNFSSGQKQLLCLARAILRNNNTMVLDEATANIDSKTDTLLQTTIRRNIHNCTVLTIAHRLNTIMDNDKVMVMENGELVEFDHPYRLLQNENSLMSKMVAETGSSMASHLKQLARKSFEAVEYVF